MSKLDKYREKDCGTTILLMGDPISGKTSALAGLLNGGYKGFLISRAPNLDTLASHLTKEGDNNIQSVVTMGERIQLEVLDEKNIKDNDYRCRGKAGHIVTDTVPAGSKPRMGSVLARLTNRWTDPLDPKAIFPPYTQWDDKTFLCIDELTALSDDNDSPFYVSALWELGLLGKPMNSMDHMRALGKAQNKVTQFLAALIKMPNRKFHIIVCTHLHRLSVNVDTTLTDEEILASKGKDKEAPKRPSDAETRSFQTYTRYPVICGQAPSLLFGRDYPCILQCMRANNDEPRVLFRAPDGHDVRLRYPAGLQLESDSLPVSRALPWFLDNFRTSAGVSSCGE